MSYTPPPTNVIQTNRNEGIYFRTANGLDIQIMGAFKELMEHPKTNHIHLLQYLQELSRTGYNNNSETLAKKKAA